MHLCHSRGREREGGLPCPSPAREAVTAVPERREASPIKRNNNKNNASDKKHAHNHTQTDRLVTAGRQPGSERTFGTLSVGRAGPGGREPTPH